MERVMAILIRCERVPCHMASGNNNFTSFCSLVQNIVCLEIYQNPSFIFALQAATTPMSLLAFQCQYLYLRTQMLQAQAQLVRVCCSFQTSPPPAIASSLAITTGKEIHRCGHIVTQVGRKLFGVSPIEHVPYI